LLAFRPLVEGAAALHKTSVVHRDVKPDNIFYGPNNLVLGDCGLALRLDATDRLTETYENAGSRDWMPGWAMGIRVDRVKPTFDVFSLGKVLWAMVSGKSKLQLWYHNERRFPQYDLRHLVGDTPDVAQVCRILDQSVVEHEDRCLPDAEALLAAVDTAIASLVQKYQYPTLKEPMRCRFCGIGTYEKTGDHWASMAAAPDTRHTFACTDCGHIESFVWRRHETPPRWATSKKPSRSNR
jgi:serine/threonine protein kinase